MDDQKKEMTMEEMEQDFKNKMLEVFSGKIPGVYRDEDGYIVVPMRVCRRRRPDSGQGDKVKHPEEEEAAENKSG